MIPNVSALKPCPFCGETPTITLDRLSGRYDGVTLMIPVTIKCTKCGISKSTKSYYRVDCMGDIILDRDGQKELSEMWNKRSLS